jgi:hypothetical protein
MPPHLINYLFLELPFFFLLLKPDLRVDMGQVLLEHMLSYVNKVDPIF